MLNEETPHDAQGAAARIEAWLGRVEREWQRHHISARDRRLLAAELQRDVEDAVANGASLDALLHQDIAAFAHELAQAHGAQPTPLALPPDPTLRNLIATRLGGGVLGAIVSWYFVYPVIGHTMPDAPMVAALLFGHGLAAAITVASALGAVAWRFRESRPERRTFVALGVGFVMGGLLSIAPVAGFARTTGYSSASVVVLVETALAAAFISAGIAVALRVAGRADRRVLPVAPS
jgi:hypothetical protein